MVGRVNEATAATDVFSLSIVEPSRWRAWAAALLNIIGQSMNADGGGRRAIFKQRVSGEVVGGFVESFVGASSSEYSVVLMDYAEMSATEFERTWLKR